MAVKVLFFGATADSVGKRDLSVEAAGMSAGELLSRVTSEHPQLARHKLLISINQEYTSGERTLIDGDEVAIFTAVSGG